jgi:major membrane immunogen (membrane-anchored lipoprotein)
MSEYGFKSPRDVCQLTLTQIKTLSDAIMKRRGAEQALLAISMRASQAEGKDFEGFVQELTKSAKKGETESEIDDFSF